MKVSVSILSLKEKINENIKMLNNTNVDFFHLDIMDDVFVNNKTWAYNEIKPLVKDVTKPFDVHLMVCDLKSYIDSFKKLNPKYITFHYEAVEDVSYFIKYIKDLDIKVGLSIKPDTDISVLYPYMKDLDLILVMSVNPGHGGQDFIEGTTKKIDELIKKRKENNYDYLISVDGGINDKTVHKVKKADIVVSGSYVVSSENYANAIDFLKLKNY